MKYLLTIVLLFVGLNLLAETPEWAKATICFTAAVIAEGIADGMYDQGRKDLSHTLNAASTGFLLIYPVWLIKTHQFDAIWAIPAYIAFRIAFFDVSYNLTRKLPYNYVGTTCWWDRFRPAFTSHYLFRNSMFCVGIVFTLQL